MRFSLRDRDETMSAFDTGCDVVLDDDTAFHVPPMLGYAAEQFVLGPLGQNARRVVEIGRTRRVALLVARLFPCVRGIRKIIVDLDEQTAAVAFAWLGLAVMLQRPPSSKCTPMASCADLFGPGAVFVDFTGAVREVCVPPLSAWWVEHRRRAPPPLIVRAPGYIWISSNPRSRGAPR